MKRCLVVVAFMLSYACAFCSTLPDDDGHTLTALWKSYYDAVKSDKPKDELVALESIKSEALSRHLPWDYYDACDRYSRTRIRISWKDRDAARVQKVEELTFFNEPVISVFVAGGKEELENLILSEEARLKASFNPQFYSRDNSLSSKIYAPALCPLIKNDYDYALWALYARGGSSDILRQTDIYPFNAFLDYDALELESRSSLESFSLKYAGKASSLLGEQQLIRKDFDALDYNKSDESEYLRIKERCTKFGKDASAFTNNEGLIASLCKLSAATIEAMEEKELDFEAIETELKLSVRNIRKVDVKITENGETLFRSTVENPDPHYCVCDTLSLTLPSLKDGTYVISCASGDNSEEKEYEKYTISLAVRETGDGIAVYAADYKSGEPVDRCDIGIYSDSGLICRASNLALDGFTALPKNIQELISDMDEISRRGLYVRAGVGDRMSDMHFLSPLNHTSEEEEYGCVILSGKSAYNPGEKVKFKVIPYQMTGELSLLPEGHGFTVRLRRQGETSAVSDQTVILNDFGSASGEFLLCEELKGGAYEIEVADGEKILGNKYLRVDEFVLPTYSIEWSRQERQYFIGDTVVFSGRIKSYSGHPVSALKAEYEIIAAAECVKKGVLDISADGIFTCDLFTASLAGGWSSSVMAEIVLSDATGETTRSSRRVDVFHSAKLDVRLENASEGEVRLDGRADQYAEMLSEDTACVLFSGNYSGLGHPGMSVTWTLSDGNMRKISEGITKMGECRIDFRDMASGLYVLSSVLDVRCDDGRSLSDTCLLNIVKLSDGDRSVPVRVKYLFRRCDDDRSPAVQLGVSGKPAWIQAELSGSGRCVLDSKSLRIDAGREGSCSLATVGFERRPEWPDELMLSVLCFRDASAFRYNFSFSGAEESHSLPLSFTRFHESTLPDSCYTFSVSTEAGVECAASVYDAASDAVYDNSWNSVRMSLPDPLFADYSFTEGRYRAGSRFLRFKNMMAMDSGLSYDEPFSAMPEANDDGHVREDFLTSLAWEPYLRSAPDGSLDFAVRTSGKLSTYAVQLFAHDKSLRNNVLRREMLVTLPVRIAVSQPRYLYEGDSYFPLVMLSSLSDEDVTGTASAEFFSGSDRKSSHSIKKVSERVTVPASGSFGGKFEAPPLSGIDTLGILLRFSPDSSSSASDAVFVTVPVKKPFQIITEAHSAVLTPDSDRTAVECSLRSGFVAVDPSAASVSETSILAMLGEALPDAVVPESDNSISLSQALFAASLLRDLGRDVPGMEDCAAKLLQCFNSDGGIAWFKGMGSSPLVTALVLERVAAMRETCDFVGTQKVESAVRYLDAGQFAPSSSYKSLSLLQYFHVRALYADVPFDVPASLAGSSFRKEVDSILTGRADSGDVLFKARRILTLRKLMANEDGQRLAASWGLRSVRRMYKVMESDRKSLMQYAVAHEGGGCYFPNAVKPWRGLLDSELRAHCLLCEVFDGEDIAEGIRLWMMLQKETQKWDGDSAFVEALSCIFHASGKTLDTRVLSLSASDELPLASVRPSGNGMRISCSYYRGGSGLHEGDSLRVGDIVRMRCAVWSAENRSFVRICIPRAATFRPVQQLSGNDGRFRDIYRWVRQDRTEYWYEFFPEESSEFHEEYFVEQDGVFHAAAPVVESIYAPHYRANSSVPCEVCVLSK